MTRERQRVIVLLDDVRSRHNVGSVFRTADGLGAEAVYLCGITPQPPHRDINKTALGAADSVPWAHYAKAEEAIASLKSAGFVVVAIEQTARSILLHNIMISDGPCALILGNEIKGLRSDVLNMADHIAEIPQFGIKRSLNVSVAAGIAMWHFIHAHG